MEMINIIKKLLIKLGFIKELSEEQIHINKISKICTKLAEVRGDLAILLPEHLKKKFLFYSFISGGCIYSLYNDEEPKDYDFFIKSNMLSEDLREYFMEAAGYHGKGVSGGVYNNLPLIITDNAISIGKFQIITRWIGTPKEVVQEFDFKHNQYYFDDGEIGTISDFSHLKSKELKYNETRARDICGTIMRIPKFIQRGMFIRQKEVAKMMLKLHEVGFNEREIEILNDASSDKHFSS